MKTRMTVGKKLGIGLGALILLLLGMGLSSLIAVSKLETALNAEGTVTVHKVELAGQINDLSSNMAADERGMIMFAAAKDHAGLDGLEQRFREDYEALRRTSQELYALAALAESRTVLDRINTGVEEWRANATQVATLLRGGNIDEAVKLSSGKDTPLFEKIEIDGRKLVELRKNATAEEVARGASQAANSRWIAVGGTLIAFAVGLIVLWTVRQVNTALRRLASALTDGAVQVSGAAGQISSSGQLLARGASDQAASLEETSASSEEIASMTRRNAEHSAEAAQLMVATADSVDGANRKMQEMVRSMQEITASSNKISKIIKVIDEIAFQTNILALNAAVEAARAGEAGMGFAVVADEVRNLAQRCAQAARNTAELIEESITRSNDGGNRLAEVANAITAITEQSSKAKVLVDEIYTGSQEQSRGIEQVATAISQMQQSTQSNAAGAEQSAAAGKDLASQSATLHQFVRELNELVGKSGKIANGALRNAADSFPAAEARG